MLAWSIVPGLGHIRGGHPLLGWSILSAWALALLLATATIGSGTSQLCFVGAIVVHTVALVTLFGADLFYETLFVRALFGMTVFLGLRYLGYGMIVNGAEHVLTPLPIEGMRPSRLLVNGDVVLYEGAWLARSPPQRGDVVVYTLNAAVGYQRIDGYGIDRIVGAAGDRVEIRHGTLRVNGALVPTDLQPLAGTGALPVRELDVTLQAHEYLILPTLLPLMIQGQPVIDGFVRQVSVVSDHRILGRVRYRVRPWSRFGRIS